jgi:hypothetical protein
VPHLTRPQRASQVSELLELVRGSQSAAEAWALYELELLVPVSERPPLVAAALAASRTWADSMSKARLSLRLLPLMSVALRATTVPEVLALVPTIERHGDRTKCSSRTNGIARSNATAAQSIVLNNSWPNCTSQSLRSARYDLGRKLRRLRVVRPRKGPLICLKRDESIQKPQ